MPRKKSKQIEKPYEPTPRELKALSDQENRHLSRKPSPRMKVVGDGPTSKLEADHPDFENGFRLLMESLGTSNVDFATGLIVQIAAIDQRPDGSLDERNLNMALSFAKGIQPRDEVEAMLAAQMAAVHMATMNSARWLARASTTPQIDSAERRFNKFARTFTTQMEALKRYRSKGEQKVTVEHVTVNEGGQAVVGMVSTREGGGK